MATRPTLLAALLTVAAIQSAAAQTAAPTPSVPELRPMRANVSAGLIASGGYSVGTRAAGLRPNTPGTPPPYTLFTAESAFGRVAGIEARVGVALTRALTLEVGGTFARPELGVTITGDTEAGTIPFIGERVSHYTADVAGMWEWRRIRPGARARPYLVAGGGYVRQLDAERLKAETGYTVQGGAGLRYWVRGASRGRPMGVRVEGRLVRRTGGIEFDNRSRVIPTASVLGFVGIGRSGPSRPPPTR
jgi:hypothetical protein